MLGVRGNLFMCLIAVPFTLCGAGGARYYNLASVCPYGAWVGPSSRGTGVVHRGATAAAQTTASSTQCYCFDGREAGWTFGSSSNYGYSCGCDAADVTKASL